MSRSRLRVTAGPKLPAGSRAAPRRAVTTAPVSRVAHARRYTARLALDPATRRDAYRLRYISYRAGNHIPHHPGELFADRYDDLPNSHVIVLYEGGRPVASVRICLTGRAPPLPCPAAETFGPELTTLLARGGTSRFGCEGVEVNRLVRSPSQTGSQGLVFLLYRLAGHLALARDFRVVFLCARPNHAPFYRRLGFRDVAGPRAYPGLSCPMRLLAAPRWRYEEACRSFPMMDPAIDGDTVERFLDGGSIKVALAGAP